MNKYERLNKEHKEVSGKKRVAAYCRVSTDKSDQSNSFESQQSYFKKYIENNADWELYEIFADEGISGTNTKKRKEFNRMIASVKNGDFDLIITKEISRFARNTLDSIYYTRDLKKNGVGVIFMNDNINTLDGDAELRLSIMASIAQEESRKTSERVKWGQKRQMEKGIVFGRSMLGYDVKEGKIFINEEGAKLVRIIFDKFVREGKGTYVIAREFLEAGIKCDSIKKWSNTAILRVLRNEKYCGDLIQKKTYTPDFLSHEKKINRGEEEFIIIKNHHTPIITRELFDKANRILDEKSLSQNQKSKYSNRYIFSGKIKCSYCNSSYVARYKTRKDGSLYKAWRCGKAVQQGAIHINKNGEEVGCNSQSIRNEELLYIMKIIISSLKFDREKFASGLLLIIRKANDFDIQDKKIEKIRHKIKDVYMKQTDLTDSYIEGNISREEFLKKREQYNNEITKFQSVIDNIYNQDIMSEQQNSLKRQNEHLTEIQKTINELIEGVDYEDYFYRYILDKIVILDKDNVDVYLKGLTFKLSLAVK